MWPLLAFLFISGPGAERNRERAGYALLGLLALNILGVGAAVATGAAIGRAAAGPLRMTKGLALSILTTWSSAYALANAANSFRPVAPELARAAARSMITQVLPGTISLLQWLAAYDPAGVIAKKLDAGEIQPDDGNAYLLDEVPR